jgi:hypothetical protein
MTAGKSVPGRSNTGVAWGAGTGSRQRTTYVRTSDEDDSIVLPAVCKKCHDVQDRVFRVSKVEGHLLRPQHASSVCGGRYEPDLSQRQSDERFATVRPELLVPSTWRNKT